MSLPAGHSSSISISKIVYLQSIEGGQEKAHMIDHGGFKRKEAVDSTCVISALHLFKTEITLHDADLSSPTHSFPPSQLHLD